MTTFYERPIGSDATSIGERQRSRWSRYLRQRLFASITPIDFANSEESVIHGVTCKQPNNRNRPVGQERPTWTNARVRTDQMAVLNLLQKRHLKATGKEISKGEVLAALMVAGLGPILNHRDFGGSSSNDTLSGDIAA